MKAILMSIKPQAVEKILNDKKTIVVRKTKPKIETPFKVYIYCTKEGHLLCHGGIGEKECLFFNPDEKKYKFGFAFELMCCENHYDKDNFLSGKVVGEFICDKIYNVTPSYDLHPNDYRYCNQYTTDCKYGTANICLTFEELNKYLKGKKGYGWHITNLKIYDEPKQLSEFNINRPPQNWQFVEEIKE